MNDIGLQDLPPDVITSLRLAPRLLRSASFSLGREGRAYVRVDQAAIDREDLATLVACPLFARIMAGSTLILIFDPDTASADERSAKRAAMLAELGEVAPEVAAGAIISREIPPGAH